MRLAVSVAWGKDSFAGASRAVEGVKSVVRYAEPASAERHAYKIPARKHGAKGQRAHGRLLADGGFAAPRTNASFGIERAEAV